MDIYFELRKYDIGLDERYIFSGKLILLHPGNCYLVQENNMCLKKLCMSQENQLKLQYCYIPFYIKSIYS